MINTSSKTLQCKDGVKVIPVAKPKYPEYMTLQSRQKSYDIWPISLPQRPEVLSRVGFFYTGKGDRVVCYSCGGGLKDWGPHDDPMAQHTKWFPQCSYVAVSQGLQTQKENGVETDKTTAYLNDENVDYTRMCNVCIRNELGVVFLPCGHMVTCPQCAADQVICPTCNTEIHEKIRAFLP